MVTIGSFEARTRFSDLLRQVEIAGERFVLTVRGRPVAVLGPIATETPAGEELARLLEDLRVFRARVAARGAGPVLRPDETWKSFAREELEE